MKSSNEAAARQIHVPSAWGKRGTPMRMGAAPAESRRPSETRLQAAKPERAVEKTDAERWADVPCTD
ncbi:MAG TPA: hypothetical protein VL400_12625 [Polyangiaceae bacterium]|jgi:hypothetical protein|nr:hypothetical protein [Polyangiaceae bacterium]